jgi:hypothetical protein
MIPPRIPNRYDDDEQRMKRLEAQDDDSPRRWGVTFVLGCLVLAAFALLAVAGWSGAGVVLVPLGLGMVLISGIMLALAWLAR